MRNYLTVVPFKSEAAQIARIRIRHFLKNCTTMNIVLIVSSILFAIYHLCGYMIEKENSFEREAAYTRACIFVATAWILVSIYIK